MHDRKWRAMQNLRRRSRQSGSKRQCIRPGKSPKKERSRRYDKRIATYCQTCTSERPAGATGNTISCRECRGAWAEECQANFATDYCSECGIPETYVRLNGANHMDMLRQDRTWWCAVCIDDSDTQDHDANAREWCCRSIEIMAPSDSIQDRRRACEDLIENLKKATKLRKQEEDWEAQRARAEGET